MTDELRRLAHYLRERPAMTLVVAVCVPLAMALLNIVLIYGIALPGSPPRDAARNLVLVPPLLAVAILQALPFGSLGRRLVLSAAFGGLMLVSVFAIHLLGACSHGDCF